MSSRNRTVRKSTSVMIEPLEDRKLLSTVFYSTDFDGNRVGSENATWSVIKKSTAPNRPGNYFMGEFGSGGTTVTLVNLPAHNALTVEFDLILIRSWDGNATGQWGPDHWRLRADGATVFDSTFRNTPQPGYQAFGGLDQPVGDFPAFTGSVEHNTLGYTYYSSSLGETVPADSIYHMKLTFDHVGSAVALAFSGAPNQVIGDESWGFDNLSVSDGPQWVGIEANDTLAGEAGPDPASFTVRRRGSTYGSLVVPIALSGSAVAGSDFTSNLGEVGGQLAAVFEPGQTEVAFSITPIDDLEIELTEDVVASIVPGSAYGLDPNECVEAATDITDNETPAVSLSTSGGPLAEGAITPGTFVFSLTEPLGFPLSVRFQLDGTATTDDYQVSDSVATENEIVFQAGQTAAQFSITAIDDDEPEWTETVRLTLEPDGNYSIDGSDSAELNIGDNDSVDISIQGLPEEATDSTFNETDPGANINVNDDDDNSNGVADYLESQADLADDDLEPMVLTVPAEQTDYSGLTLALSADGANAFRIWAEDGTLILGAQGGGQPALTLADLSSIGQNGITVYVEALQPYVQATVTLTGQNTGTSPSSYSFDQAVIHGGALITGYDLDLAKVDQNVGVGFLDEAAERKPGAYVPMNNDDDDYSATGTGRGEDLNQNGGIDGENDLLPIVVRGSADPTVKMKLTFEGLQVYQQPDRTQPLAAGAQFNAPQNDWTLYVEGRTSGRKIMKLWVNGKETDQTVVINVFQWEGPLNVPEWGTYNYKVLTADTPGGWRPSGEIYDIVDGANTRNAQVRWQGGPVVGHLEYLVNDNYQWSLDVNVVDIQVIDINNANDFTTNGTAVIGQREYRDRRGIGPGKMVDSFNSTKDIPNTNPVKKETEAIAWAATVQLTGPENNRGVRQMEVGFIQNLKATKLNATFTGVPKTSSLEGNRYWDTITQGQTAEKPFYDLDPGARFTAADFAATGNTKRMQSQDSPFMTFPIFIDRNHRDQIISALNVQWDFDLYVAAKTIDTRNKANLVLTTVAESSWQWNPGSNLDATTHQYPAGTQPKHPTVQSGWSNTDQGVPSGNKTMLKPKDTARFNDLVVDNSHWYQ